MIDKNSMQRIFIALEIPQDLRKALIRYEKELPFWKMDIRRPDAHDPCGSSETLLPMRWTGSQMSLNRGE